MWFFDNYRDEGSWQTIPGVFANQNFENITTPVANSAAPWTVVPDTNLPARNANSWQIASARMTTQLEPAEQAQPVLGRATSLQRRHVDAAR